MIKRAKTHDELYISYISSVKTVMRDIEERNEELKLNNDYSERTQLHKTMAILRKYFYDQGGIPL